MKNEMSNFVDTTKEKLSEVVNFSAIEKNSFNLIYQIFIIH